MHQKEAETLVDNFISDHFGYMPDIGEMDWTELNDFMEAAYIEMKLCGKERLDSIILAAALWGMKNSRHQKVFPMLDL